MQPAQHLEPVEVGQHDVEDDDVGLEVARDAQRGEAVSGGADVPALVAQGHREQLGKRRLVVDDEGADRAAARAGELRLVGHGRRLGPHHVSRMRRLPPAALCATCESTV